MDECLRVNLLKLKNKINFEFFQEDKSRVEIFNTYARMKKEQLWTYFFNMLGNQDQFVVYQVKAKDR